MSMFRQRIDISSIGQTFEALEEFGLGADAVNRRLIPVPGYLTGAQ